MNGLYLWIGSKLVRCLVDEDGETCQQVKDKERFQIGISYLAESSLIELMETRRVLYSRFLLTLNLFLFLFERLQKFGSFFYLLLLTVFPINGIHLIHLLLLILLDLLLDQSIFLILQLLFYLCFFLLLLGTTV